MPWRECAYGQQLQRIIGRATNGTQEFLSVEDVKCKIRAP